MATVFQDDSSRYFVLKMLQTPGNIPLGEYFFDLFAQEVAPTLAQHNNNAARGQNLSVKRKKGWLLVANASDASVLCLGYRAAAADVRDIELFESGIAGWHKEDSEKATVVENIAGSEIAFNLALDYLLLNVGIALLLHKPARAEKMHVGPLVCNLKPRVA